MNLVNEINKGNKKIKKHKGFITSSFCDLELDIFYCMSDGKTMDISFPDGSYMVVDYDHLLFFMDFMDKAFSHNNKKQKK